MDIQVVFNTWMVITDSQVILGNIATTSIINIK